MEEFIKAAARPALSVMFGIAIVVAVLQGINLPEWFLGLAIPAIVWWFGERTVTHAKERNSASIDKLAEKVADAIIKRGQ
jgi:hypothetical protein